MIDLFDSNKSRLKEDSANALPDFIANLKKTSATDIASLLDGAKRVKLATIMANESSKDRDIAWVKCSIIMFSYKVRNFFQPGISSVFFSTQTA